MGRCEVERGCWRNASRRGDEFPLFRLQCGCGRLQSIRSGGEVQDVFDHRTFIHRFRSRPSALVVILKQKHGDSFQHGYVQGRCDPTSLQGRLRDPRPSHCSTPLMLAIASPNRTKLQQSRFVRESSGCTRSTAGCLARVPSDQLGAKRRKVPPSL